jgi:hypothetical protein
MSYKQCFFAVPASAAMDQVLGQFAEMARELRSENGYSGIYLATSEIGGLRMLYLAATPAPRGRVPRSFFTERWGSMPLFVAVYDDQHGIFLWEHVSPDGHTQGILSDGKIGVSGLSLETPLKGTDAITLGLSHFGYAAKRGDFLDLLHAESAWSLLDRPPVEKPLPPEAGPIADFYIESYEWSAYDLPARSY